MTRRTAMLAAFALILGIAGAPAQEKAAPAAPSAPPVSAPPKKGDKVAVVDMEKIFKEYYRTKVAEANLKKQAEVFREYAETLNESMLKLQEEFRKLRDDAQNIALSDVERENKRLAAQDKYRQMKEKEEEFKQYSTDKQNVLRDQYEEQRAKLLEEIKSVIQRKCVAEGYDIVLDSSGKTLNNIPTIIYFKSTMDLTDVVIEEINLPAKEKFKDVTSKEKEPEKPKEKPKDAPGKEKEKEKEPEKAKEKSK